MVDRAARDLPALTVLALLANGPRHTYEMHRQMIDTRKDFVTGLPRSLYHAVDRLVRDELIVPTGTDRAGSRPERTTYALTDAGRDSLHRRIVELIATPDPDSTLLTAALSFALILPAEDAVAALRNRAAALQERLDGEPAPGWLPRALRIEDEFARMRMRAEHDWVDGLALEIETGELDWPDPASLVDLIPDATSAGPPTS